MGLSYIFYLVTYFPRFVIYKKEPSRLTDKINMIIFNGYIILTYPG